MKKITLTVKEAYCFDRWLNKNFHNINLGVLLRGGLHLESPICLIFLKVGNDPKTDYIF